MQKIFKMIVVSISIMSAFFGISEMVERFISNNKKYENNIFKFLIEHGTELGFAIAILYLLFYSFKGLSNYLQKNKKNKNLEKLLKEGNHTLILGLGVKQRNYIEKELEKENKKIIVIEKDDSNKYITEYDSKVSFKYGEAREDKILASLNWEHVKKIIVVDHETKRFICEGNNKVTSKIIVLAEELPSGIESITKEQKSSLNYHAYLSKEKMPFISRTQFLTESKHTRDKNFKTEDELYDELFNHYDHSGLFIKGEGGVGKTRLMLELARKANDNGWKSFKVLKDFTNWENLNEQIYKDEKYCFIFDYIEESPIFSSDIVRTIKNNLPNLNDNNLKIIVNTRNSYREDKPVDFFEYTINSQSTELAYLKFVVKNILAKKINTEKQLIQLEKIFQKPSMAIFLLESEDITNFKFNEIKNANDFIRTRLRLTFNEKNFNNISKEVFYLFASLPIKKETLRRTKEYIKPLIKDGWIEEDKHDNYISKYNDTIIDTILLEYIKENTYDKDDIEESIEEIFDYANSYTYQVSTYHDNNCFYNSLRSIERVSDELPIQNINYGKLFEPYKEYLEQLASKFTKSSNFNRLTRIKIIDHLELEPYDSIEFGLTLSRIMDNNEEYTDDDKKYITEIYAKWIKYSTNLELYKQYESASFLIQGYYNFFGNPTTYLNIDDYAIEYLKKFNTSKNFTYVLTSYLQHNDYSDILKEDIITWVNYNLNRNVYKQEFINFLDHISDKIKPLIINLLEVWLNQNIEHNKFSTIYKKYILLGGEQKKVKLSVIKWLNQNIEHDKFNYTLQDYLKNGGDLNNINDTVVVWINNNSSHKEFNYIVQDYLNKNGDIKKIEKVLIEWIKLNVNGHNNIAFSRIIGTYTKYGDIAKIEEVLVKWIKENVNNRNNQVFSHIVGNYDKYGADISLIKNEIRLWLDKTQKDNLYYRKFILHIYNKSGENYESNYKLNSISYFHNEIYNKGKNKNKFINSKKDKIKKSLDEFMLNNEEIEEIEKYLYIIQKYSESTGEAIEKHKDKLGNYIIQNLNNIQLTPSMRRIYLNFLAISTEEDKDIKNIIEKNLYDYLLKSKKINSFYRDIFISYQKYNFTPIENNEILKKILTIDITQIKYYIQNPYSDINTINMYMKQLLTNIHLSNIFINKKINPILNVYMNTVPKEEIIKNEFKEFVKKNISLKNIIKIILQLETNKFYPDIIDKLIKEYIVIHSKKPILETLESKQFKEKALNRIKKFVDNEN